MLCQPKPEDVSLDMLEKLQNTIGQYKYDGERLLCGKFNGKVIIWNRSGRIKNSFYPELELDLKMVKEEKDFVLDGEVVTGQGKIKDFANLQSRAHKEKPTDQDICNNRVTFYAFDIIIYDGEKRDMTKLWDRLSLLKQFFKNNIFELSNFREVLFTYNLIWLYEQAKQNGYEGIVLKDINGYYNFRKRSFNYLKYKPKKIYKASVTSYNTKKRVISSLITNYGDVTLQPTLKNEQIIPALIQQIPNGEVTVEVEADSDLTEKNNRWRFPVLKKLIIEEKIYEQI